MSRPRQLKLWIAVVLIRAIVHLLGRTYRFQVVEGAQRLAGLRAGEPPALLALWHNRILPGAYFIYQRLVRQGLPMVMLVSRSKDGELGERLARGWRARVIRGSTTRGGTEGLRQLYRAISRDGCSSLTLPDGPHGPLYHCKPGVVVLAQTCGAPILPLAFAANRFWALRSWDRLIIPKPFAQVLVAVGEPLTVPRQLTAEQLEEHRQLLESALNAAVEGLERRLGR